MYIEQNTASDSQISCINIPFNVTGLFHFVRSQPLAAKPISLIWIFWEI